jgi:hypothetical protein
MKKQINSNLLKSLINTEFLILQGKPKLKIKNFRYNVSNRIDRKIDSSLDLFELVKSLKQFVRILQLLKGYEGSKLVISSANRSIYSFLKLYDKKMMSLEFLDVKLESTRSFGVSKKVRGLLLLDESIENKVTHIQKFLREKIVLITALNSMKEGNTSGTYKIYNDILDFKKLAFLMTLISNVVANTKKD